MDYFNVMGQLATQLDTISGLRVTAYPPDEVYPPAGFIDWPDSYNFDETYGRGADRTTLRVVVLVDMVSDRASHKELAAYVSGSGSSSVKQVLESGSSYTAFDSLRVMSVAFATYTVADAQYRAAVFSVDVVGSGA